MENILSESCRSLRIPREEALRRMRRVILEELTDTQREVLLAYYFQEKKNSADCRRTGCLQKFCLQSAAAGRKKTEAILKILSADAVVMPRLIFLPRAGFPGKIANSLLFSTVHDRMI